MVDNVPEMYLRSVSGKENFTTESREKERMTGNITVLQCDRKKKEVYHWYMRIEQQKQRDKILKEIKTFNK